MKRIIVVLLASFMLGACSLGGDGAEVVQTLSGQLLGTGSGYVLMTGDGQTVSLESNVVDLNEYVGGTVSVTGQFSGSTLYVDEVD
jgi:hypothetical protein